MQITDINKLVRIFLLGSFGTFLLALHLREMLSALSNGLDKQGFAIPLGLLFLGVITALGSAIEGFAHLTIVKVVRASIDRPLIGRLLWREKEVERVHHWQADFQEASRRAADFPYVSKAVALQQRSLAGGLVHKSAPAEHVKYIDTHYNIFVLSSGLAVLFFGSPIPLVPVFIERGATDITLMLLTTGCLAAGYSLCSLALLNYLFVWEASLRYGCLLLWEKPKESPIQPTVALSVPQNPDASDG